MRSLLVAILLLITIGTADAAINLVVSQQAGTAVRERAGQLAGQLGGELGTPVNVVVLPDTAEVEAWLNRYATAELALVEAAYVAGRPGRFVTIGTVGPDLVLIGRQGIGGDLPQRAARVVGGGGGGGQPVARETAAPVKTAPRLEVPPPPTAPATAPATIYSSSKSSSEDRYFVIQVYREKFGRDPEPERLEYWTQQLQGGVLSKQQFAEQVCRDGLALCTFQK